MTRHHHGPYSQGIPRANGGPGYGRIMQYVVPRLLSAGVSQEAVNRFSVGNPRSLFEPDSKER